MRISSIVLCILFFLISCHAFEKETLAYREEYKAEFLEDERSPLEESDLVWLDFFPPNKRARVRAKFKITPDSQPVEIPTYSGTSRTYRKWGEAFFKWEQDSARLFLFENMKLATNPDYKDYLFLPFTDESNGNDTYGGGRYIDMSKQDTEDGMITIDFNRCYNPWCAYSDGYNCPIPPVENYLPFRIEAGEKKYKGVHKTR